MADTRGMDNEGRKLVALLEANSYTVTKSGGGHFAITTPEGKRVGTISATPSDYRSRMNELGQLIRAGLIERQAKKRSSRPRSKRPKVDRVALDTPTWREEQERRREGWERGVVNEASDDARLLPRYRRKS